MTKRFASLALGLAFASMVFFAVGCNKSSSNPTGTGGSTTGTFADLVGFWFSASDTSGIEIRSDSTVKPLTVDNTGRLVYSADTAGQALKITSANAGNMTGTIRITIPGVVDTTLPFSGTFSLSADKNTLTSSLVGPFGPSGQITTQTNTSVRSFLNAQVLTGGGGGGGGTGATGLSFQSNKGNFSCDTTLATATLVQLGQAYSLSIEGFKSNSSTSADDVFLSVFATTTIGVGTYNCGASTPPIASVSFNLGFNPSDTASVHNECELSSGSIVITSISATHVKGTFSGSGVRAGDQSAVTVTNGAFDVSIH